jgi:GxxExxY protein
LDEKEETTEYTEHTERRECRRDFGGEMSKLLLEDETYRIRGACFEVYKDKGAGFLEGVYQECLCLEFAHQGIPFVTEQELHLFYRGRTLVQTYKPDFICFGAVIVEIKAVTALCDEHRAQVHNYLKATGLRVALLINFGHYPMIEIERIVR